MQEKYSDTEPIFRLKPVFRNNVCEVKLVGYMDSEQKLGDELMEFETSQEEQEVCGTNVDFINKVYDYTISAAIYKNNIVGSYLLKHTFLPVYSISIAYSKAIVSGFLFDIFIGFELDEESIKVVKDPRKCVNARLYGKFVLKLFCDDEVINSYDSMLDSIGERIIEESQILEKMNTMSEEDFLKFLDEEITKRREFFVNLKDGIVIPELFSVSRTVQMLRNVYKLNDLTLLYESALNVRQKERQQKYSAIEEYKIPTNVINIKDIENNPDYLDERLGLKQKE
jgi:hypothetical protein